MRLKRHYHFENVLGIDNYNLRNLRALKLKLSRDYLTFFEDISGLYRGGKQKNELDAISVKIRQVIGLLDGILSSESIGKKDVENLSNQLLEINEDKDYFLKKVLEIKALNDRVNKVTKSTGLSVKDLNITENIVKGVVNQTRRAQKEHAGSFLSRSMPGTLGMLGGVGKGILSAAAGPFAPTLGAVAGDILHLGGGIVRKPRERKEIALGEQLRSGSGKSMGIGGGTSQIGTQIPFTQSLGGGVSKSARKESGKAVADGLDMFFNRRAYRAKWTKDLLGKVKNYLGGSKGLKDKLTGLTFAAGAAGLALGKAGLAGGIFAFTGIELVRLVKTTREYLGVLTNLKNFRKKEVRVLAKREEKVASTAIFGETEAERQAAKRARNIYAQARTKRLEKEAKSWSLSNLSKQWSSGTINRVESSGRENLNAGPRIEFNIPKSPMLTKTTNLSEMDKELFKMLEKSREQNQILSKSINTLSSTIGRDKTPTVIGGGHQGNPYDSADILLDQRASGDLTINER